MNKVSVLLFFVVSFLVVAIVLSGLNSNVDYGHPSDTRDWGKLQPLISTLDYKEDGKFSLYFVNWANTSMIREISINETISRVPCADVEVYRIETMSASWFRASPPLEVKFGDDFIVSASCPPKERGANYELLISIDYNLTSGSTQTETGRIKSCVGCINH
jgi:hypothetical protein